MVKIIILVLVAEIVTAFGQILFKKSTNAMESYSLRGFENHKRFLGEVLSKPSLWAGFLCLAAGLAIYLVALAQGDLSLVFPLGSIQYIFILFAAHQFLGEKIDAKKLAGTFLVVFGIILISLS